MNCFGIRRAAGTTANLFRRTAGFCAALGFAFARLNAAPAFVTGWGANEAHQIEPPLTLTNVIAISAGFSHAIALRQDGTVTAWGDNAFGQTNVPTSATNITAIATGHRHNLALRGDGSLIGWGDNGFAQVTPPASATSVVATAAGGTHSLALRSDGTVAAWGGNTSGQSIVPGSLNGVQGIAAGAFHSLALRSNGTVTAWGYNGNGQITVPGGLTNVIAIASAFNHSLALRSNGTVAAWGFNGSGQTNVPPGLSNVIAIAAGFSHSLALRQDGTLVSWGGSIAGEGTVPEGLTNLQRVTAGGNFTLALAPGPAVLRQPADALIVPGQTATLTAVAVGQVSLMLQWQKNGEDIPGETNATLTLPNVQYSQFGDYRLRVSDANGTVFSRSARLLAPPIITSQPQTLHVPYGASALFQLGVTGSGPLSYRWLTNSAGPALGTNSSFSIASVNYQHAAGYWAVVSNSVGIVTSAVAQLYVHAMPSVSLPGWLQTNYIYDSEVYLSVSTAGVSPDYYQWEWNGVAIPGATNEILRFPGARPAVSGVYRCVAVGLAGNVATSNLTISVARANPVNFTGRRAVLEAGDTFGLVRGTRWLHDGLEIPNQTNTTLVIEALAPSDAGTYTAICNYAGGVERAFEVGRLTVLPAPAAGRIVSWGYTNQLPGFPISTIQDAVAVAMGDTHVLALRADGRVFQWGYNGSSSDIWRSLEPVVAISAKGSGAAVLGSSGRATSDTGSYCSPCGALETNRFVDVAFGGEFAIGLRNDGTAIGWGINGSGQASVPATLQGLVAIAAGAGHAMALRHDGTVAVWGSNDYGQTNIPAGLSGVKAIACGWGHCLALRSNGVVVAWGQNSSGQRNMPGGLAGVTAIGAGPVQSFAVRSDGSVVAWGDNSYGQCSPPVGLSNVVAVVGGNYATAALVGGSNNPAILEHPVGGVREIGAVFTFNVRVQSAAPLSYQWRRNGTNIPGAVGASLTFTNLQIADEGDYTVAVSTSGGTTISDGATLLVNPTPFLSLPSTRGGVVVWGGQQYPGGLPTVPPGFGEVAAISAGANSFRSFAIRSDGTANAWSAYSSFVISETDLVSIVPSGSGYLGLRANGVVGAWGSDGVETAPPPGLRDVVQLIGEGSGGYIAVRSDGSIQHPYAEGFFPTDSSNVVQAALGQYHGVLLLGDGTVVLGRLSHLSEQTPVPIGLSNVVRVAAGAQHTVALRGDGTVFAWGRNNEGQCTVPLGLGSVVAVAAGQSFSMALRADGTVSVWGDDSQGQRLVPPGLTNVAAIAAGYGHCLALQRGPVILAPPTDLNVPPGQTATFQVIAQGSAPLRYQWSFRGEPLFGATNSSLNVVAALQTEGLYSVNVSNNDGAISADAMLWLGLPPEILAHPEGGFIPAGGSKTFMVLASGLAPLRYQWQSNGTNITSATNSIYGFFGANTNRSGDYRVIVTNVFGAATSQVARLTVVAAPAIVSQPTSQTRAEGETVQFTVITAGGQPQSYQWRFNGSILPGQTNPSLLVANVRTNDAGAYSVQVSNIVAAVTSADAILTVVAPPPRFVVAPSNQVASFGSDVRWDVTATGASPLSYQWYFNNVILPGAVGPSLLITNVDSNLAGSYQVVVSNTFGSITSAPAQLTLRAPPNVILWGTNDVVRAIPPDLTNAVAVSASEHVLALRDDGTVVAWNDQGQTAVPAGLSNVVAVSSGSGHSLALRSDGHVFAWGSNSFGETNVPANLTNAIAIAAGSSHSLALRADGTVSGWGYNAYGQASPPPGLSNVVGITANEGASLAVKRDGTVVRWGNGYFPPPGLSNVTQVMGRARMLALRPDGRVVGWDWASGGAVEGPAGVVTADSYSAPYFVPPNSTYLETHEIGLLTNGTVAIWGTNRGGIFSPPPGLSNVLAVSAGYFFNVAIVGGPTIVTQPRDVASSVGRAASFEVQAISRSPMQYQWRFNGTNLPGATNATLTFASLTASHAGPYSVVVRDAAGSVVSRTATLRVLSDAPYLTRQPVSQAVSEGNGVSFAVAAEGTLPLTYQWFHNGNVVNGATQNVFQLPATAPGDAGLYAARVSNVHGTAMSAEAMLTLGVPDVIVDNSTAAITGAWQAGSNPSQIGTNYLFIPPGWGANRISFVPLLPRDGSYSVSSRFFTQAQPLLTPALHMINHTQGSSATIPAAVTGWSVLGTFMFASGNAGSVVALDTFPNAAASGLADAVRFSYVPSPPAFLTHPTSTNVVEGAELTLSVAATGAQPLRYQWQFNGVNLPGASAAMLVISPVDRNQAGGYRVLAVNTDGARYSQDATVRVVAPPLQLSTEAGSLVLRWSGTATLQTATSVAGPYEDIPAAASPLVISPDESQRFFRLKR